MGEPKNARRAALPDIVHHLKSLSTMKYRQSVLTDGWPPFPGRLWQRNYYEHIIRNEVELSAIRQYILQNPLRWHLDPENPASAKHGSRNEPDY
jgi:putative transposase